MKTLSKWSLIALATALTVSTIAIAQTETETNSEEFPVGTTPDIQPGQTYVLETFGHWELLCVKVETGNDPCEVGQLVLDENSSPVADIRAFPLPAGAAAIAGLTFVTPLGVSLPTGLVFVVDDKAPKQYPYQFCNQVGCVARLGLTPLELQAMRKGEKGTISLRMISNTEQQLDITVSLKGFAAAFAALTKLMLDQQGQ